MGGGRILSGFLGKSKASITRKFCADMVENDQKELVWQVIYGGTGRGLFPAER
jgi:hypothetical protein